MHTDHLNSTINNSLQPIYSFSPNVSDFLIIFALITILGNAHRPYKQYTNIVESGLHHLSSFFPVVFSPNFLAIFSLITILRNVHRPCKQYPNTVNNLQQYASSFSSDFFLIFSLYLCSLLY